jgi:hypothetical protein
MPAEGQLLKAWDPHLAHFFAIERVNTSLIKLFRPPKEWCFLFIFLNVEKYFLVILWQDVLDPPLLINLEI